MLKKSQPINIAKNKARALENVGSCFGQDFQTNLLLNLGYAARMYPNLWKGLESDRSTELQLSLYEAFDFLKESAWVLEDSVFKVIVPSWYTPVGCCRAKISPLVSLSGFKK